MHHTQRKHHRHNIPTEEALAYYDSPFGLDSHHGYGESKVEDKIDVGVESSDGEEVDAPDQEGDFEPSQKQIEQAKLKYNANSSAPIQSLAQEGKKKTKKHKKKALAETEEQEVVQGANDDAVEAERARQQALKAQEEAESLRLQAKQAQIEAERAAMNAENERKLTEAEFAKKKAD